MIRIELAKQLRRARTWTVMAAIAALSVALTVTIATTRADTPERVGNSLSVISNTSGLSMPLVALSAMSIFVFPLAVAVFAGETVAGEASWGSLRYLLAHPVGRTRVLTAKLVVAAMCSAAALCMAAVAALAAGFVAFGVNPMTVLDIDASTPLRFAGTTFSMAEAFNRIAAATGLLIVYQASTFGFALLLSTLTSRPFSAVAGGVGLSMFSRAIDNIPGMQSLRGILPATDAGANLWTGLFATPGNLDGLGHFFAVQLAYTGVFLVAAWVAFTRADVLS